MEKTKNLEKILSKKKRGLIDGLEPGDLERLFEDPDMGAVNPPPG